MDWAPNASLAALKARAQLLTEIRSFFDKRGVLEVETPLLCQTAATDPYLSAIPVANGHYFLQTSPEFAMKRLLAAGIGPIYQLCKAFRSNEVGRIHNPEFSILEWYRPGFDHHALMDEMAALLTAVLGAQKAERITYQALFLQHFAFDPHSIALDALQDAVQRQGIPISKEALAPLSTDDCLDLLLSHCLEPHLGQERPLFIYDYPETQAALAKVRPGTPKVAERFEVYVGGLELANGYHELVDADIQLSRFEQDLAKRQSLGLAVMPIDDRLLAALSAGLPDCAGVALGVDRLLMLKIQASSLDQVISFTTEHA